jgi:hypothetical protein
MNNQNTREKMLELLNFEGPVLKAKKANKDEYVIYDQWDSIVDILTEEKFYAFLEGDITLSDSNGKNWNYKREHNDAKPKLRDLINFITK